MNRAAGGIFPRVYHRLQSQARCDLSHLIVGAADVDGPRKTGTNPKDLSLPAQSLDAQPDQRLAAGEIDRGFQKEAVDQLDAAPPQGAADFVHAPRLEIHDGDEIVDFRKYNGISWVVANAVQMVQVAVGAINAFFGKIGQPPATSRMEFGNDECGLPRAGRFRWRGDGRHGSQKRAPVKVESSAGYGSREHTHLPEKILLPERIFTYKII